MQTLFRIIAGKEVVVTSAALLAGAAVVLNVLPYYLAALLVVTVVISLLTWEVIASRRRLIQEHAAHVAKSTYLANMSHELRTPLNAIIGFSEVIKDELMGPLGNGKYREYAGDIHASASHLLELINDVLELSRIEAGRLDLHEMPTDLTPILVSCQRLLREHARRAGLKIDLDCGGDLPEIVCDATKIKQVVLNLMTNAIKFTPRGGRITVRAFRRDGIVAITVADTGIGIPANEIPRVLTPFVQAAHTHVLSDEGTGLGLPLAKKLIELHGGALMLESRFGEGTQVTVTLPAQRCRATAGDQSDLLRSAPMAA